MSQVSKAAANPIRFGVPKLFQRTARLLETLPKTGIRIAHRDGLPEVDAHVA